MKIQTNNVERRDHLFAFVNIHHFGQLRKYTNDPYFYHVLAVANMSKKYFPLAWECGLCHDLLEDTFCTVNDLLSALQRFGYNLAERSMIIMVVNDLTDVYTTESYPHINRTERKRIETLRMANIAPESQTVKYCDFIHNTESITKHDPSFAKVYLAEKKAILNVMTKGDKKLRKLAYKKN